MKAIALLLPVLLFSACSDDIKDEIPFLEPCQKINGSVQWDFDGSSYCADGSIIAGYTIGMSINAQTLSGVALTMQIDSVQPGTYAISQIHNAVILTDPLGLPWTTLDNNAGTVTITSNDTVSNKLQATFNCTLKSPTGASKQLSNGTIKVTYIK